jgi:hypothetical protein
MPRYKGRPSPKEIKKDFPHTVEMRVPFGSFGSKLNAMHQWHEARGIRAIHSTGRRDENKRDYIRWCFADPIAAKDFCPPHSLSRPAADAHAVSRLVQRRASPGTRISARCVCVLFAR